jgi:predicted porin
MNRLKLSAAGIVLASLTGVAHADTNYSLGAKVEALYTSYSKEFLSCWREGYQGNCSYAPKTWEGENYVRGDVVHDLTDDLTLIGRAQAGYYYHNAWYTRSPGVSVTPGTGQNNPDNPTASQLAFEDTWVGLKDARYGTVKLGRGLNPRMQALEGTYTTDLGGKEMLTKMISYDSPMVIGDRSNGIKFSYALYKGALMRKEIRQYDANDQAQMSRVEPTGNSILLDATLRTKLNVKFAYYKERFAARDHYYNGHLDGQGVILGSTDYTVIPKTGAMTAAHGPALLASYEFSHGRLGFSSSRNNIDKVAMVDPTFPSVGYKSQTNTLIISAWYDRWSLWSTFSKSKYRMSDTDFITPSNDWLYSNNTFDYSQYKAEISYEMMKNTKAIVGAEFKRMTFYNSSIASGMCQSGMTNPNPCYNPRGYKVFSGLRWTY